MELFLDVLGESLVDTAKMLPFLFLAYLLIEYIEHRHGERIEALLAGGGRWGAVPGALLGCVPQCGFSAIASNFYASRVITLGTLMAVYLATSDEAIPLLVSMPAYWDKLVVLMVIKVVYAVIVGFVLDFVLRGILGFNILSSSIFSRTLPLHFVQAQRTKSANGFILLHISSMANFRTGLVTSISINPPTQVM